MSCGRADARFAEMRFAHRDERYEQTVEVDVHPSSPCRFEFDPGNAHEHIHPQGWNSHLVEVALFREIVGGQSRQRCTELLEGLVDDAGISGAWIVVNDVAKRLHFPTTLSRRANTSSAGVMPAPALSELGELLCVMVRFVVLG